VVPVLLELREKLTYRTSTRLWQMLGLVFLLAAANDYFRLGMFGIPEKWPLAVAASVLMLGWRYIAPTLEEVRKHRDRDAP
jgi:hypothetical protein